MNKYTVKIHTKRERERKSMTEVKVLGKKDLVNMIAEDNAVTKKLAAESVDYVVEGIKKVLADNNTLRLAGFATFSSEYKEAHTRTLGFSGEEITVPAGFRHKAKLSATLVK